MMKTIAAAYLMTTALTVAPALAQANHNDAQSFVTKAAEGGMFEVQSSQLALKKSQDKDIRDFAQHMIDDHTKANDKLKSLAKNEKVPTSLDNEHQQMLTKLEKANGSDFADQYKQEQVTAHQQTIDLFQGYAQHGGDQQLKQFAEQTLPTLNQHLQMAQQITIASNGDQRQQVAQSSAAPGGSMASAVQNDGNRNYLTHETEGTWRASKMIGLGVYNEQDQRVGDINEVLFGRDGKVEGVVIGVGGFLGIGERNVAVPYNDLKWSMTSQSANRVANLPNGAGPTGPAANPPGLGNPASPLNPAPNLPASTAATERASAANPATAYPDHAILPNASKEQLQKAPQFQYGSAPR